jgi:Icc-related predicted phosphoesterase
MRAFIACNNEGKWNFPQTDLLILNGDLVNLLPKPPKKLEGSIAYRIAGEETGLALDDYKAYKGGKGDGMIFARFADELFRGKYSQEARALYKEELDEGLEQLQVPTLLVHGNLDFPDIVKSEADRFGARCIDTEVRYGTGGIGGLGGVPRSANPLDGKCRIFEAEREDEEYLRLLRKLEKECTLLVTHMHYGYYQKLERKPGCRTVVSAESEGKVGKNLIIPPDYSVTGRGVRTGV